MKKVSQIISHLKTKPYLKNLRYVDCYNQLLSLLPKNISQNTKFLYQKNDTLFFVLNHPGIKMEFNYKSNLIKSILKKLIELNPECYFIKSSNIKAFVTNKPPLKEINYSNTKKTLYQERAGGKFTNSAKNMDLNSIFEKIRVSIKQNRQNELT